jgi:predicted metal-dependent HD superfamily phosphohydrolase
MTHLNRFWPLPDHAELRDRLVSRYADPTRGYHDVQHLAEVLERADLLLADEPADRTAVLLAAWFHDAVYDGQGDDERRSADLVHEELDEQAPTGLVEEVARLVRLTERHDPEPDDTAGAVLCDADLAILAADRGRYDEYVAGVRKDYAHLEDRVFGAGRAGVLADLLARDTLFHTKTGRRLWEERARANLSRELAQRRLS